MNLAAIIIILIASFTLTLAILSGEVAVLFWISGASAGASSVLVLR